MRRGEGDNSENYQNRHFNYGPTSFDRRHAFVATFTWEMPKLRKANAIVRHVAGDWQVSGVIRLQSGPYSTVTGSTSTGTRRADYVGGDIYASTGQNVNNWLNKAAFATASAGAWGNSRHRHCRSSRLAVFRSVAGQTLPPHRTHQPALPGGFLQRSQYRQL